MVNSSRLGAAGSVAEAILPPASERRSAGLNKFLVLFYIVLFLTAFPSNSVYYLAPLIVVLWPTMLGGGVVSTVRLVGVTGGVLATTAISLTWNALSGVANNYPGLVFAGVTWLPIVILLANKGRNLRMNDRVRDRIVLVLSLFVILQAFVVALQMTQTKNWDALAGTYGLLDFLGNITISQVFFTFNIFMINLFLINYSRSVVAKIAIVSGFLAVAAAQSGHQTVFFILTLLAVFSSLRRLRASARAFAAAGFLAAGVMWFFPQTPDLLVGWLQKTLFQDFPKKLLVLESYGLLQEPKVALIGTGVAQFTSRAALFSSGEYLAVDLPSILTGQSTWFVQIVTPLLELQERIGEGSAVAKPYFSVVTIVVEFGLILAGLLAWWIAKDIFRARRLFKTGISEVDGLARYQIGFLVFLLLCSTVENYFEFVQALMLPIMLYIFSQGRVEYCLDRMREEA